MWTATFNSEQKHTAAFASIPAASELINGFSASHPHGQSREKYLDLKKRGKEETFWNDGNLLNCMCPCNENHPLKVAHRHVRTHFIESREACVQVKTVATSESAEVKSI